MAIPRRYLPSIGLLTAFEAVCRTGSTLAAARDLDLTQGGVSRSVQHLEAQLGVGLFQREGRRLVPTSAALGFARDVARALDLINRAAMRVSSNAEGGTLALSILPAFGTRWLAPRLHGFLTAHPGITLNLGTRLRPFDFEQEGFDAAIHFGDENWPNAGMVRLFDEQLIATAAPGFLAAHPVAAAADLLALPLLQLDSRPQAWSNWFALQGVARANPQGMLFDQFAPMIEAAIHGLGVALLPQFLAETELASGRLVPAFGPAIAGVGSYYLVWPHGGSTPAVEKFRDWLVAEAASLRVTV